MSLNNGSKTSKNDFYSKTAKNVESDFYSKTFQKKSSERGSPPQYEEAIQHLHPRKPSGEYHQFNKQQQQQHQQQQQFAEYQTEEPPTDPKRVAEEAENILRQLVSFLSFFLLLLDFGPC
jgi:hypothetical protein